MKTPLTTKGMFAGAAMAGLIAGAALRAQPALPGSGVAMKGAGLLANAATPAKHSCKGLNSCKGQGGCMTGDHGCKGKNSCKGKGGCSTAGMG